MLTTTPSYPLLPLFSTEGTQERIAWRTRSRNQALVGIRDDFDAVGIFDGFVDGDGTQARPMVGSIGLEVFWGVLSREGKAG